MKHESLGLTIEKLQYLLLVSIPIFGYIYKYTFLFFLPILIFVVVGFGQVKRKIVDNSSDDILTKTIFSIGRWAAFLWFLEMGIYFMIKAAIGGA